MSGLEITPQQQLQSLLIGPDLVLTKEEDGLKLRSVGRLEYAFAWLLSCMGIHYVTNTAKIEKTFVDFLDQNKDAFHQEDITTINLVRDKILIAAKNEDHAALTKVVSDIETAVSQTAIPIFKRNYPDPIYFEPPTKTDIKVHIREEESGEEISVPVGKPFAIELTWTPQVVITNGR